MMKKMALAAAVLMTAAAARAADLDNRWFLGGGYGWTWPQNPDSFRNSFKNEEQVWTTHLGYHFSSDAAVRLSYSNFDVNAKHGSARFLAQPFLLGLKLHLVHDVPVSPYLVAGAGVSVNQLRSGPTTRDWNEFAAMGGGGIEFFLSDDISLAGEERFDYLESDHGAPFRLLSTIAMVNFYFGPKKHAHHDTVVAPPPPAATSSVKVIDVNHDRQAEQADAAARQAQAAAIAAQQAALEAQQRAAATPTPAPAVAASTPEATGTALAVQEAQGQMEQLRERIQRKELPPILFATASDKILAASYPTLDEAAGIVKQYPNLKLRVEGHTDNVGDAAYNQALSQRRADAVRSYLVSKGVDGAQVTSVGFGASKPIAPNDTPEGRNSNRRVEFVFEPQP